MLALTVLAVSALAQTDKPGLFEVRSATAGLDNGVYLLDARLQYILSSEALAALDNGVPLNITIDIEVIEQRRFLPDDTVATLAIRFQLQYHALSQRYLVQNVNTGEQDSFATLFSALNNLGRLTDLPIIDAALLDPDRRHRMRLRSTLEFRNISGPLRMLAFWLDDWDLRSDWFEWTLDRSAE
ncbi:MAG: DUF4390 domain-containing protein [Pseudomonadota bacterium]